MYHVPENLIEMLYCGVVVCEQNTWTTEQHNLKAIHVNSKFLHTAYPFKTVYVLPFRTASLCLDIETTMKKILFNCF